MQQQPQQTPALNSVPQLPLNAVTTEQIQKCLDDNKNLILAILENQNLGKLAECAQYQAILQKNLMYLAAIADAQQPPQGSVSSQQQQPVGVVQSPTQQMPKTQATSLQQQQVPPKLPFQQQQPNNGSGFPSQEQQQQQMLQFHQQQQQFQGHQAVNNAATPAMHHQLMRPAPANGLEANSDGLNTKLPPGQGGGGGRGNE
ncbi:unnamed protein product [Cuscuta campestris]|uniref:SS18 N-terminal domain-containing protein n=1 Tax=Cuscuta campestris TaxID=132261 RepID=A0A484LKJ3_9ASTE|nr:unnamed protein product [Cuscuta campestris]